MTCDLLPLHQDLLHTIPAGQHGPDQVRALLQEHPEVRFVSLVGIDHSGHDTDEKIPVGVFLQDIDGFLAGGVQTDGSSVVLPAIATLNDGKVDLVADLDVTWFIDYNHENRDPRSGKPCGTLRIPSFLRHDGLLVDSRAVLRRAVERFDRDLRRLLDEAPEISAQWGVSPRDILSVSLTAATELEFWVRTPDEKGDVERLSVSQGLKEQYWKRTRGVVRTALEQAILVLERYGLQPEMGHKEVGGVMARFTGTGGLDHVMEQLEIDWRYAASLQAADNELFARIFIKEVFRLHGLEATFLAKPMDHVAGSGEHIHVNAMARLADGRRVNLFAPENPACDFLNSIGWGALMGFMKHYDTVGPFITCSNDGFARLKPGFEAPTHAVASLGRDVATVSRNRTVLLGLIRSEGNPLATRFEIRSPNPHTNVYLALAAIYQSMLDGIRHAVRNRRTPGDLQREFFKEPGESALYLDPRRAYRSEEDVFETHTEEERNARFGRPPATVHEAVTLLRSREEGLRILTEGDVFSEPILRSYMVAMLDTWKRELADRILPEALDRVRQTRCLHQSGQDTDLDDTLWETIDALRIRIAKDTLDRPGLSSQIREALERGDDSRVSELQLRLSAALSELDALYLRYRRNQV